MCPSLRLRRSHVNSMSSSAAMSSSQFAGLRALAGCGGCAAKAPAELVAMLTDAAAAAAQLDDKVLVGLTPADDAAVYSIDRERALVATVDFFPPIVDDPCDYGTVAAANAVSDIYAMGGTVAFALAVSGFPAAVPADVVAQVNRAASELMASCGGVLIGGHSIRCQEPVFGLCVMGFVSPSNIWKKSGAMPGDALMLSKPLGTGILISSRQPAAEHTAIASMRTTNRQSADALKQLPRGPHAVTDVSGYGLLGHALEMASRSAVLLRIVAANTPLLAGALQAAQAGVRTSAHQTQISSHASLLQVCADMPESLRALLHDPQTSGGLLVAVAPSDVAFLQAAGFALIGGVESAAAGVVVS